MESTRRCALIVVYPATSPPLPLLCEKGKVFVVTRPLVSPVLLLWLVSPPCVGRLSCRGAGCRRGWLLDGKGLPGLVPGTAANKNKRGMRKRKQSTRADVWPGLELPRGAKSAGGELAMVGTGGSLLGARLFVLSVLYFVATCVHKRAVHKGKKMHSLLRTWMWSLARIS